ncbi:hypothetical protein [Halorubrum halophilum]|uniref:hypothetical protein n=1 Tax=Halorubrum halophilum TaxID=413816 RepID=UPI0012ABDB91|nr:hypothetical protein [Halorubrum halophilum]
MKEKVRGEPDDTTSIDASNLTSSVDSSGRTTTFDTDVTIRPSEDLSDPEPIAACSSVLRETYWQAPSDGQFDVTALYDIEGNWSYRFNCPDIVPEEAVSHAATNLIVLKNPEQDVATDSATHADYAVGNVENRTESLLRFLIKQLVSRYLPSPAGLLAGPVVGVALDYASAIWDSVTGDCSPRDQNRTYFSSEEPLSVSFGAKEGEIYKVVLVSTVGCEYNMKAFTYASYAALLSVLELNELSIQ